MNFYYGESPQEVFNTIFDCYSREVDGKKVISKEDLERVFKIFLRCFEVQEKVPEKRISISELPSVTAKDMSKAGERLSSGEFFESMKESEVFCKVSKY